MGTYKFSIKEKIFFYLLFAFIAFLTFYLVRNYIPVIAISLIISLIANPIYKFFLKILKNSRVFATIITIAIILLAIILPSIFLINMTLNQIGEFNNEISTYITSKDVTLEKVLEGVNLYLSKIPGADVKITTQSIKDAIQGILQPAAGFVVNNLGDIGSTSFVFLANIMIFFVLVSVLVPNIDNLIKLVKRIIPLPIDISNMYINRVVVISTSMFKGTFFIAILQGIVAGIFLWIAGVKYVLFWSALISFLYLLPLGGGLVLIPIGAVLILTGNVWQGIFVLVTFALIVNYIDNVLRPLLIPKEADLNPALVVLSVFGGLAMFGFFGVIFGPVIMILMVTTVEVYLKYFRNGKEK